MVGPKSKCHGKESNQPIGGSNILFFTSIRRAELFIIQSTSSKKIFYDHQLILKSLCPVVEELAVVDIKYMLIVIFRSKDVQIRSLFPIYLCSEFEGIMAALIRES